MNMTGFSSRGNGCKLERIMGLVTLGGSRIKKGFLVNVWAFRRNKRDRKAKFHCTFTAT